MDKYTENMIEHYKIQSEINVELLMILQRLCPGTWVMQIMANIEMVNNRPQQVYLVTVTNGDDNVTATNKNLGAAISQVIYYLLNGSVFPLTGNMGMYIHPEDAGYKKSEPVE